MRRGPPPSFAGVDATSKLVDADARRVAEIVMELRAGKFVNIAERAGRARNAAGDGGLGEPPPRRLHVGP
jgi:hypothetical protein